MSELAASLVIVAALGSSAKLVDGEHGSGLQYVHKILEFVEIML